MSAATATLPANVVGHGPRLARAAGEMPRRVKVGPWDFEIILSDEPIVLDGYECDGLCDKSQMKIYIAAHLPPQSRLWVLLHEIAHAWATAVGRPKTEEDFCNLFATACVDTWRKLGDLLGEAVNHG